MKQNKSGDSPYAQRLLRLLLMAIGLIVVVHLVLQYLNFVAYGQQNGQIYELSNRFDLDDEASVPTWFSQVLFLLAGVGSFLAAAVQTERAQRRLWLLLGVLGIWLSVDEVAALHEYALQTIHVLAYQDSSPTMQFNAWWLVAPVLAAAASWLLWHIVRLLPRRTTMLFAAGGALFLVGAVAVDVLANTAARETFLNQGILVALEEGMELVGCATVLYAIVDYLERTHREVLMGFVRNFRLQR